jgi:pSer/pThr/pTyr-binding forkhead associated (FHA) protein
MLGYSDLEEIMASQPQLDSAKGTMLPFLEHYPEDDGPAQKILLQRFPFQIGRGKQSDFIIYSRQVSKIHSVIQCDAGVFSIADLGSTNGTFVNNHQVRAAQLRDGDIIHIATGRRVICLAALNL